MMQRQTLLDALGSSRHHGPWAMYGRMRGRWSRRKHAQSVLHALPASLEVVRGERLLKLLRHVRADDRPAGTKGSHQLLELLIDGTERGGDGVVRRLLVGSDDRRDTKGNRAQSSAAGWDGAPGSRWNFSVQCPDSARTSSGIANTSDGVCIMSCSVIRSAGASAATTAVPQEGRGPASGRVGASGRKRPPTPWTAAPPLSKNESSYCSGQNWDDVCVIAHADSGTRATPGPAHSRPTHDTHDDRLI